MQIAKILKEDKVLTAKAYYAKKKEIRIPTILMIGETIPFGILCRLREQITLCHLQEF